MVHRLVFQKACLYYLLDGHVPTVQAEKQLDLSERHLYTLLRSSSDDLVRERKLSVVSTDSGADVGVDGDGVCCGLRVVMRMCIFPWPSSFLFARETVLFLFT